MRLYVHGNKTDRTDVKGILEAYRNEDIRSVPLKTPAHQTVVALHRLRGAWVAERTARLSTSDLVIDGGVQIRLVRQPAHATSWPGLLPRPVRDATRTPGTSAATPRSIQTSLGLGPLRNGTAITAAKTMDAPSAELHE